MELGMGPKISVHRYGVLVNSKCSRESAKSVVHHIYGPVHTTVGTYRICVNC